MTAAILEQEQRGKKHKYKGETRDKKKRVNQRREKEMRVIWTDSERHQTGDSSATRKEEKK